MRAAIKALIGMQIPFVRTPKAPAKRPTSAEAWGIALRLTRFESFMTLVLALAALLMGFKALTAPDQMPGEVTGRLFLSFWLTYYAVIFAAAPIYAYKSFATLRTDAEMAASPGPLVPA
jgi:hypothetical protein